MIEDIKRITARIRCCVANTPVVGTAFAITEDLVLTCAHCLRPEKTHSSAAAKTAELWFYDAFDDDETEAIGADVVWDGFRETPPVDLALLRLKSEHPDREFFPIGKSPDSDSSWTSFGYVVSSRLKGEKLHGTVEQTTTRCKDIEGDAVILHCEETEGRDNCGGASGSAVVVNGAIVAVLCIQPWREGKRAYGQLAAVALDQIRKYEHSRNLLSTVTGVDGGFLGVATEATLSFPSSRTLWTMDSKLTPCSDDTYALGVRLAEGSTNLDRVKNVMYEVGTQTCAVSDRDGGFRCLMHISQRDLETDKITAKVRTAASGASDSECVILDISKRITDGLSVRDEGC